MSRRDTIHCPARYLRSGNPHLVVSDSAGGAFFIANRRFEGAIAPGGDNLVGGAAHVGGASAPRLFSGGRRS